MLGAFAMSTTIGLFGIMQTWRASKFGALVTNGRFVSEESGQGESSVERTKLEFSLEPGYGERVRGTERKDEKRTPRFEAS